jgi:hypothetical protein
LYGKRHDFGQADTYFPTAILAGIRAAQVSDWGVPVAPTGFFHVFSMLVLSGRLISGSHPITAA